VRGGCSGACSGPGPGTCAPCLAACTHSRLHAAAGGCTLGCAPAPRCVHRLPAGRRSCPPPNPHDCCRRRALELLQRYYEGQLASLDEDDAAQQRHAEQQHKRHKQAAAAGGESQLLTEQVKPRAGLPPLLVNLAERPPEPLHYLGVSYGLTQQLYGFWRRAGFQPVYLRQSPSDVTGEHTVVMLRPLQAPGLEVQVRAWGSAHSAGARAHSAAASAPCTGHAVHMHACRPG
jgi:hypothetical protein